MATYNLRWGTSNDFKLPDYGPEICSEQELVNRKYQSHVTAEELERYVGSIIVDTSGDLDGVALRTIKNIKFFKTIALKATVMQILNLAPSSFPKARTILNYKKGPIEDPGN